MAVLIDFSGVMHASFSVALQNAGMIDNVDTDFMRHLILSQVLGVRTRFKDYYSGDTDFILCMDSSPIWRKELFPEYKASRKVSRDASKINWKIVYHNFNKVMEEVTDNLPYISIRVDSCEADDCIGILAKHQPWPKAESIMFDGEDATQNLIYSNDKDMRQCHLYNFTQYFPAKKVLEKEPFPEEFLLEKIIRGDVGDGIPNIRSEKDALVTKTRQPPITKKFVEKCLELNCKNLSEEEMKRFRLNKTLIDFNEIPPSLEKAILDKYKERVENKPKRNKLMTYFASKGLNKMLEKIQNF